MKRLDECWRDIASRWERLGDSKRAEEARRKVAHIQELRKQGRYPPQLSLSGGPDGDADLWWSVAFVYGELAEA
jgi:hypothetical protein